MYLLGMWIMEKVATVPGPIKQYRRAVEALLPSFASFHATSPSSMKNILASGVLRPGGTGLNGTGVYFGAGMVDNYGSVAIGRSGSTSALTGIKDILGRERHRILEGPAGTSVGGKGDFLLFKHPHVGSEQYRDPRQTVSEANSLVSAARKRLMRVVGPAPADKARRLLDPSVVSPQATAVRTTQDKVDLIREARRPQNRILGSWNA